jgi:hypothetical protein
MSNADDPEHTRGHRRSSSTSLDFENSDAGDAELELRLASAAATAMAGVLALSGDSPPTFGAAQRSRASSSNSSSRSSTSRTSLLHEARSSWAAFISEVGRCRSTLSNPR